jgi:hypothetical protein
MTKPQKKYNIKSELYKYAPKEFKLRLLHFVRQCSIKITPVTYGKYLHKILCRHRLNSAKEKDGGENRYAECSERGLKVPKLA